MNFEVCRVMIDIWEERTNEQQDDVELKRDRIAI
jgi:hypothetical protein